eukprot:gnl/MRDRNA2_/MRDRNA2_121070_c0_seq1.p1 gnl/MRDRNA2_/MRDRNA2_121070_c0~~gnl/MRDRNA2_/MRDRNA2_121070_c0_seq1.p1  ORF type:complete len:334 (+),score=64.61 gnl/MRDRNA2_/MRDRNA2_121070_c0_seq1:147-1148(+)
MMTPMLLIVLLARGHGLKIQMDQEVQCPEMPTDYKTWDNKNAFYFGVLVDGKDAKQGPHVYDWDNCFFPKTFSALQWLYSSEKTQEWSGPLTMDIIMQLHGRCCKKWNFEKEGSTHHAARDVHPKCSNMMSCEERVALLDGMWKELYQHNGTKRCPKDLILLPKHRVNKQHLVKKLVKEYNQAIEDAQTEDQKLTALARLSRTWMWIHPMSSGNGRLHSLILQREVRRLGLGCGLMMFNQNKDAFVNTQDMMKGMLKEGLTMFAKSARSGRNEWLDESNFARHFESHKLPKSLKKCEEKKSFGSGGNIMFSQLDGESSPVLLPPVQCPAPKGD